MTGPRPVLLVDIDGVLNVYGVDSCPEGFTEYHLFPDDEEPTRLAPVHGQWLRELSDVFDLVWASGWGFQAHEYLGPILDIEEFPFVPMPPIPFPPLEKVPAIASYVGDRPAAWVDDVVVPEALAWARVREAPTILIQVDHREGLQRTHVDQLMTWARSL